MKHDKQTSAWYLSTVSIGLPMDLPLYELTEGERRSDYWTVTRLVYRLMRSEKNEFVSIEKEGYYRERDWDVINKGGES